MSPKEISLPRELVWEICRYVADASTLWTLCNTARWMAEIILDPHFLLPHIIQQSEPVFGPNAGGWFDLTNAERKRLIIKQALLEQGKYLRKFTPNLRKTNIRRKWSWKKLDTRLLLWIHGLQVNLWDLFNDTCIFKKTLQNTRRKRYLPWGEVRGMRLHGDTIFVLMGSSHPRERYVRVECLQVGVKEPQHLSVTMGQPGVDCCSSAWFCGKQLHVLHHEISSDLGVTKIYRRLDHWDLTRSVDSFQTPLRRVDMAAWCKPVGPWYLFISVEPSFAGVRGALLLDTENRMEDGSAERECEVGFCPISAPDSTSALEFRPTGILDGRSQCYVHLFDTEKDRGVGWPQGQDQYFRLPLSGQQKIRYYYEKAGRLSLYDSAGTAFRVHRGEEAFW